MKRTFNMKGYSGRYIAFITTLLLNSGFFVNTLPDNVIEVWWWDEYSSVKEKILNDFVDFQLV